MNNSKPKREITIPEEIRQKWQGIVNLIAKIINVPAALIMKIDPPYIEVFRSSESANNPYKVRDREHLAGLYCETVIKTREKLLIPNALKDKHWKKNPDIKLGMISYLGFPLLWPNDEVFGTICVLDSKENKYSKDYKDLILLFKETIEAHLTLLYKNLKLENLIATGKEIDQKLKDSEEKYRLISENANDMIHIFNEKFEFEYINEQAFMKFMGYLKDDLIGKSGLEFIHPADLKRASKELRGGFKRGKGSLELRLRHKNGTYRWIEVSGSVYIDKDEKRKALLIGRDVTNRKKVEKKLKESEARFKGIFESKLIGTFFWDANGDIIDANDVYLKMVGYSKDEVLSGAVRWRDLTPSEYTDLDNKALEEIATTGVMTPIEKEYIRKDGSRFPILVGGSALPGSTHGGVSFVLDITERKLSEQRLKESEVKYRHLFETSPYFIGLLNTEGILIDCNDAIKDLQSIHTIEDVKGKNFIEIILLNEKNKHLIPMFEKFIKSVFEGANQEMFDFRLSRAIGGHLWLYVEATLIEIEKQKFVQFIMQDITERKRSEQLLQESMKDLARINTELEQFTYVASHDLKEPLRMISSFAQLLEKQYKDKLDEGANDFIRFIIEGVVRMQDLINNLLKYSKIGKSSREFEKVDLNNVLKDAIDNLKKIINETNAEVIYDSLPSLFVDKYQLLQVFQNLISNAIKFHGESPPLIHVSARPDNKHWVFSVRDNGIGIDSKDYERIFIIFKRLHTKDEYGGTGIGLAICKKIVEQYGGKIWVESEVGNGSTFYFSIPKEIDIKS